MLDDDEFYRLIVLQGLVKDDPEGLAAVEKLWSICADRCLPSGMRYPRWGDGDKVRLGDRFRISGAVKTVAEIDLLPDGFVICAEDDSAAISETGLDLAEHVTDSDDVEGAIS